MLLIKDVRKSRYALPHFDGGFAYEQGACSYLPITTGELKNITAIRGNYD